MSLIPKFLFLLFQKKDEPELYKTIILNNKVMSKAQKELIKSCRKILSDNNVPLNKIRFILESSFMYDIDKNTINPTYKQLIPKNKKRPIIEIDKPKNLMTIFLGEYETENNFDVVKTLLKKTKKGLIILANNIDYNLIISIANLDDAIIFYNQQIVDSVCDCE
jgi:hypothetical protein